MSWSHDVDEDKPQSLLGAIIREQRELAELPMRQLAKAVGISNPYLSQIERGLRAPSEAVAEAIAAAPELTAAQRRAMSEIHRSFIDANRVRRVSGHHDAD